MAFQRLKCDGLSDAPKPDEDWPFFSERYILRIETLLLPVYLVDTPLLLDDLDVQLALLQQCTNGTIRGYRLACGRSVWSTTNPG